MLRVASPSTASSHLASLAPVGLVAIARQGRHRYFRIATPEVAAVVEALIFRHVVTRSWNGWNWCAELQRVCGNPAASREG